MRMQRAPGGISMTGNGCEPKHDKGGTPPRVNRLAYRAPSSLQTAGMDEDDVTRRSRAYVASVRGPPTVTEIAHAVGCSVSAVMRVLADTRNDQRQDPSRDTPESE